MGIVTIIWLAISGGVIIAARLSTITREYFLFFLKKFGVTNLFLSRKKLKLVIQKLNLTTKLKLLKEIYSCLNQNH